MTRADALPYVAYVLDEVLTEYPERDFVSDQRASRAVLVGWQCGFEPLFVAVCSGTPGGVVAADDAEDLAIAFLEERSWFATADGDHTADYVLEP